MARLANCCSGLVCCSHEARRTRICTYAIGYTVTAKGDASQPLSREDGRLREFASIACLVEPGKRYAQATL